MHAIHTELAHKTGWQMDIQAAILWPQDNDVGALSESFAGDVNQVDFSMRTADFF